MDAQIGKAGKRIAFLGNISHKKGVELFVHAFNTIHKADPEFTLHIGGGIQDPRYAVYLDSCIPDLGLQDSIQYYGFVEKPLEWLPQFDWILCTSPLEGSPVGVLEAFSVGLSPLIYAFAGARDQYPADFIWKDFDELTEMIKKGLQDAEKIKKFVKDNYSLDKQLNKIGEIINKLDKKDKKSTLNRAKSTVSAVIAVKNGEKTIERAITSLLNQTKPLQKIVVIDDHSTDNTTNIVRRFTDSKTPIELVEITPSRWVFLARNEGLKYLKSDYFFFLDADDWVDPTYAEKLSEVLDLYPSVNIVYPDMVYFNDASNEQIFQVPEFDPQILVGRNFIAYAAMQRVNKFRQLGGYSGYLNNCRNHLTEWEFWLQCFKNGYGFKHIALPLFHYYKSGDTDQMSGDYEISRESMQLQMVMEVADAHSITVNQNKPKILLVCQGRDYLDGSKVGFEIMTWAKPLEMNGKYEVFIFQYDVEEVYFEKAGMIERLHHLIELIQPAYIFHPSYKDNIPVEVWKEISEKWNTICFNSDDNRRYESYSKEYNSGFRWAVTTYPEIYDRMDHPGKVLSQWGVNTHYLYPREKTIDVSFCGQAYGDRKDWLKDLNVACYGKGWSKDSFVDFKRMAEIIGKSRISINFSSGADGAKQLKLRPFEVCGSNTLCLCESVDGIENWYEPGKEMVLFSTKDELRELIAYYLEHEDERKAIAQAGYERTLLEHTWFHRFDKIFEEISK